MKLKLFLKKIFGIFSILGFVLPISGCLNKGDNADMNINFEEYQLAMPQDDEEIAVVKTDLGDFKIKFFPGDAPKAVENFKTHCKNKYYNGVIFHRVIEDFMIQGGDPQGTGKGGESIWGKSFEDEFSKNLVNITGAVSMANSGPNTNASQFFVNYQNPSTFSGWDRLEQAYNVYVKNPSAFESRYGSTVDVSKVPSEIKSMYEKYGGNPHLDGFYSTSGRGHTVFGQVFEGLDVVEKISKVETDSNSKPLKDVKINSIEIEKYKS